MLEIHQRELSPLVDFYKKIVHLLGCNKKKHYLCSVDSR